MGDRNEAPTIARAEMPIVNRAILTHQNRRRYDSSCSVDNI